MLVVFLITGVFILLGILYIFHLKREIRRIIEWIEHNEHIYSVNVLDKDIENLALSINKRIKEDERKEHQLKKQDKNSLRCLKTKTPSPPPPPNPAH
mgnify:CR=1 FL=1